MFIGNELHNMGVQTILIAVGQEDSDRAAGIVETVAKIADPAEARIVVGHVLKESELEDRLSTFPEPPTEGEETEGGTAGSPRPDSATGSFTIPSTAVESEPSMSDPETVEKLITQMSVIRNLTDELEEAGFTYELRGVVGYPAEQIIEMAKELQPDFLVVGGRDQSPTRKALFGSVSQTIMASADCPVITLRHL